MACISEPTACKNTVTFSCTTHCFFLGTKKWSEPTNQWTKIPFCTSRSCVLISLHLFKFRALALILTGVPVLCWRCRCFFLPLQHPCAGDLNDQNTTKQLVLTPTHSRYSLQAFFPCRQILRQNLGISSFSLTGKKSMRYSCTHLGWQPIVSLR